MADNRMWLRCEVCGGRLLIGKSLGDVWYTRGDTPAPDLDAFYEQHRACFFDARSPSTFRVVYEVGNPNEDDPLSPPEE